MISQADDDGFAKVRSIYQNNEGLKVPRIVRSYTRTAVQSVEIKED
jgi:hypothetical protein